MALSEKELTEVLARLKAGKKATINSSGGRYESTWSWNGTQWQIDSFEEGSNFVIHLTEEKMRADLLNADEEALRRFLRGP